MVEEWRPVQDRNFPGRYTVSNLGNVARIISRSGQQFYSPLKPCVDGNGYVSFRFSLKGKQKHPLAHRVVWAAFNGPIPKGMEINHKNGIKRDNRLVNLELATRSENMLHGFRELDFSRNRLRGPVHPKAKLFEADVLKIIELREAGKRRNVVAQKFNISATAVHLIESGRNWGHLTGRTSKDALPSGSLLGSGNSRAKLKEADIPKIFALAADGMSQRQIANKFGVKQQAIQKILSGQRWKHLGLRVSL